MTQRSAKTGVGCIEKVCVVLCPGQCSIMMNPLNCEFCLWRKREVGDLSSPCQWSSQQSSLPPYRTPRSSLMWTPAIKSDWSQNHRVPWSWNYQLLVLPPSQRHHFSTPQWGDAHLHSDQHPLWTVDLYNLPWCLLVALYICCENGQLLQLCVWDHRIKGLPQLHIQAHGIRHPHQLHVPSIRLGPYFLAINIHPCTYWTGSLL